MSRIGTDILFEDTTTTNETLPSTTTTTTVTTRIENLISKEKSSFGSFSFAGYHSEILEAKLTIESGLGIRSNNKNNRGETDLFFNRLKKPRGLLLTGPRGSGKTLLMNNLANYYRPFYNSIHTLSPDILLSR